MQMPWFKLFHEARTDPKLRALSRDQHYVWFNLLCYANEQAERGLIRTMDDEVLACAVADGDVELLRSSLERLVKLQLIDRTADGITPHGWAERQAKVDTTSADRSRRYRERHKAPKTSRKTPSRVTERDATRDERVTSRPVTEPSRYREREEDKYNTPQPPTGVGVCVSTNGSEPEPISKALPSEPAKPPFDDAELTRVGQRAEKLFPMADFGGKIRGIAGDGPSEFPLAWIDAALTEMHSGEVRSWKYLLGILRRYAADGGPKPSAQSRPRIHNPNPPPPGGQYHRSPQTIARLAEQARARATMESAAS